MTTKATTPDAAAPPRKLRFTFIDEFRGLIGIMMALGHAQYYMNSAWLSLDPLDPFFDNTAQFAIRYMGYLCAPGFLMMNGAMVYWAFLRRRKKGLGRSRAVWDFVQRGLFLVVVQSFWVNSSWGGFTRLRPDHTGIIATIGISMIIIAFMAHWDWWKRALVAAACFLIHPLLLQIPYSHDSWLHYPMQFFVDAGDFTKYPLIPWFALACVGSVMAHFWFTVWTDKRNPDERAYKSMGVGLLMVLIAFSLRDWGSAYANIFPSEGWFTYSFFLVQKYPPSLAHQVWFAGAVIFMVGLWAWIDNRLPILRPLAVVGKVPLFYYCIHIPLLAIVFRRELPFQLAVAITLTVIAALFSWYAYRRADLKHLASVWRVPLPLVIALIFAVGLGCRHLGLLPYHGGDVSDSLLVWVALLGAMAPLAVWFGKVKRTSKRWLIRMI